MLGETAKNTPLLQCLFGFVDKQSCNVATKLQSADGRKISRLSRMAQRMAQNQNRVGPTPTSTRDLGRAREAYTKRSAEASRAAHDGVAPHELRRSSSTDTDTATDTASSRSEATELTPYRPALPPIVGSRRALERHSSTPSEYVKSMVRACHAKLPLAQHAPTYRTVDRHSSSRMASAPGAGRHAAGVRRP